MATLAATRGTGRGVGANMQSSAAAAGITISENELYRIRKETDTPVFVKAESSVPQRDAQAAKQRATKMKQHDLDTLQKKIASGQVEGEAVEALAKHIEPSIKQTYTAQRFLAEERKGKVVLELERQLELKRQREEEETRLAQEEHERLIVSLAEAAQKDEARFAERIEHKRQNNAVILQQLEEVHFRKMVGQESKEQEAALLLAQAKRAAEAAEAAAKKKKEWQRQVARETMEANRVFAERDAARKAREAEENEQLRLFQLQKAAREEEADRKRREMQKEKQLQQAKLLAEQTRAMDNSAAQDEKRAREHEERVILAERAKGRAEDERKRRQKEEVQQTLDYQLRLKEERKRQDEERERELQAWQVQQAAVDIARDAERMAAKRAAGREAMATLVEQKNARIEAMENEKRKRPLDEARQLALVAAAEKIAIERFRSVKLQDMQAAALPEPFTRTVAKLKHRTN